MDWMSWVGFVGVCLSVGLIWYGVSRIWARERRQAERPSVFKATVQSGDSEFEAALQSGDPEQISNAPLPPFFSEDHLLRALIQIQNQPSRLDQFIERLKLQLTLRQYRQLVASWNRFYASLEAVSPHSSLRLVYDRLNMAQDLKRARSFSDADIAEQELRAAEARYAKEELGKSQSRGRKKDALDLTIEEKQRWEEEQNRMRAAGIEENSEEWLQALNRHEARVNRISESERD
jgi:hypothetical protein